MLHLSVPVLVGPRLCVMLQDIAACDEASGGSGGMVSTVANGSASLGSALTASVQGGVSLDGGGAVTEKVSNSHSMFTSSYPQRALCLSAQR
jgi:hypothetical protein